MNLPLLRTLFFEDPSVGMTETPEKTISSSDVVGFAQLTGDRNPIHLSEHFAARTSFGKRIAHGLYTASLISEVLGTRLSSPGAVIRLHNSARPHSFKVRSRVAASPTILDGPTSA